MDATELKIIQDLLTTLENDLGPILTDAISKLPATYQPIASIIEQAALPAIMTEVTNLIKAM